MCFRLFSHESKVHNLNYHLNCAFWMIIWKTVFWTVCTPNYIAMTRFQMTVRRCFPFTHLSNHAAKSPYECPDLLNCDLGAELRDLLTTSAYNTARCTCYRSFLQARLASEPRACLIGRVPKHSYASSPRSRMQNSKFGLSCVHCIIQNAQFKW